MTQTNAPGMDQNNSAIDQSLDQPDHNNKAESGLPPILPKSILNQVELSSQYELNDLTNQFLLDYVQGILYQQKPVVSPIESDEFAAKLAKVYEKVRRIIDWKEENLIRRTAIERILKRTLLSEISGLGQSTLDAEKITGPLVLEMVRSGYFSNKQISKNKIPLAKQSLAKYIYIINNSPFSGKTYIADATTDLNKNERKKRKANLKEKVNFFNWILEIAACEIEEILEPSFKENALINFMTFSINNSLKVVPQNLMTDEEVLIQTYIAVHRSLFSLDSPIISYNLIKYRYPQWFEDNSEFIKNFADNIEQIQKQINADLDHKYGKEFFKICERQDAAFLIFGDVMKELEEDPELIEPKLKDKKQLFDIIGSVYEHRLSTLRSRLYRSAVYSTLSIFVAGVVSFVVFEGPIAEFVGEGFSLFALFVDLAVPSALMFILVITIQPPKKENLSRVKEEILKVILKSNEKDEFEINLIKKRNWLLNFIFSFISLLGGLVGAFAVYLLFKVAGVPWTSIYVDVVNVAMVVFAAMVIRHKAQELTIQESGGILTMAVDFFYLPLARVGQWLSAKWKEYNIVSVFFTALVDAPFFVIVGLVEDWRSFLRDRRSEIH
jgi:hypothetical protein